MSKKKKYSNNSFTRTIKLNKQKVNNNFETLSQKCFPRNQYMLSGRIGRQFFITIFLNFLGAHIKYQFLIIDYV